MDELVLIVEDDPSLSEVIRLGLQGEGFRVVAAGDGRTALAVFASSTPDLVLLDIMLPGLDGFAVCRELRKTSLVPIIMLTARSSTVDIVVGLESGADDYVTKPFEFPELLARVRSVLRRASARASPAAVTGPSDTATRLDAAARESGARALPAGEVSAQGASADTASAPAPSADDGSPAGRSPADRSLAEKPSLPPGSQVLPVTLGDLTIDPGAFVVRRGSECIPVTVTEFRLLYELARHAGQVLSRDQLLELVWGYTFLGDSRLVDVHVQRLRAKIEEDPAHPQLVLTVRGVGYRADRRETG